MWCVYICCAVILAPLEPMSDITLGCQQLSEGLQKLVVCVEWLGGPEGEHECFSLVSPLARFHPVCGLTDESYVSPVSRETNVTAAEGH